MKWRKKKEAPEIPRHCEGKLAEIYRQVQIIKSDQPSMAAQEEALNKIEELSRA